MLLVVSRAKMSDVNIAIPTNASICGIIASNAVRGPINCGITASAGEVKQTITDRRLNDSIHVMFRISE